MMNFAKKPRSFLPVFSSQLLLLLITTSFCWANGSIRPSLDVAQFMDSSQNTYLEIYYAIPESGIKYEKKADGKFGCQLVADIEIHLDKKLWANKAWKIEKTISDTSAVTDGSHVVDVIRYFVEKPGQYDISMRIKDMLQTEHVDSAKTTFEAEKIVDGELEVSDIQLASKISRAKPNEQGPLVKNNYTILPNPTGVFGEGSSSVYYYFEAYNLSKGLDDDQYKRVCKVIDANGVEQDGLGITYTQKPLVHDTSIEIGMLNVTNLASGKYQLVYGIADSTKTLLASKEKLFYVYNPSVQPAAVSHAADNVLNEFSSEELDTEFEMMLHITTKGDREFYSNLTNPNGKREFLMSIWARPNDENLPAAMHREQYLGRANYANDKFKSIYSEGWKSDRGRVFILYGIPSNIERFPSSESTVPHQIWTYDKLRGQAHVQFVFADPNGFNKYELMHSDLRGERNNPSWKADVYRGSNERQFR